MLDGESGNQVQEKRANCSLPAKQNYKYEN